MLERQDGHVYLVTQRPGGEDRRDLGTSNAVQTAYYRWLHMLEGHSRDHANTFLWGVLTGMSVALWEEIDRMVKRP
jgi:hypothetical protein